MASTKDQESARAPQERRTRVLSGQGASSVPTSSTVAEGVRDSTLGAHLWYVLLVLSGPVQEVSGRRVHYRQTSNLKRERLRTVET